MLRRSLTILLPLSIAVVATGCTTFSDGDAVARVGDVELTSEQFQDRLLELGVDSTSVVPLDPIRDEIGAWIYQQLVADIDVNALYADGPATSGVVCTNAILVEEEATADQLVTDLADGADFADLFEANNVAPSLAATGGALDCAEARVLEENRGDPVVDAIAALSFDEPLATAPVLDAAGAASAWAVLQLRSLDELSDAEIEQLAGLVDVSDAAAEADIHVDPRYGTFDPDTGTVVGLG